MNDAGPFVAADDTAYWARAVRLSTLPSGARFTYAGYRSLPLHSVCGPCCENGVCTTGWVLNHKNPYGPSQPYKPVGDPLVIPEKQGPES